MKKIVTLCLTAGLLLGVATGASAVDFNAKGQWIFGFGLVDSNFNNVERSSDTFAAQQRVRLQLDAIASESLSGTVSFEIGDQTWGNSGGGAALGADGIKVEVRNAYLDWIVPNTELSIRMGIQPITLPNVAGGSAVHDDQTAGIIASYKINDMVSVGAAWARPYNDNYKNELNNVARANYSADNYLDNVDLFTVFVPVQGDGWNVTPWGLYGAIGRNSIQSIVDGQVGGPAGTVWRGLVPANAYGTDSATARRLLSSNPYGTALWFGLPMSFQFDAFNLELDLNYGSVAGLGETSTMSLDRRGWLIKALFEYQMDWGTPGLFAWYGSGDDDDLDNGSESMPFLNPCGNFTSFMGDGNEIGYSIYNGGNSGAGYDLMMNYSGTWGIGLQLTDFSFMEDLSHTIRVAYWGGTNHKDMAKVVNDPFGSLGNSVVYLTTDDYLVEVNFDSTYSIYENLDAILQVGYIFNGVDKDNWANVDGTRDAYRVGLFFNYSF